MNSEVIENHKIFLERIAFFKKYGLDQMQEREFILSQAMPIQGNILEIGTGKGHFALALAKRGYKFTSIDIDQSGQRIAQLNLAYYDLLEQVDFKIEDAEHLSFVDKSFDLIFCINVYHHLTNPLPVLEEMLRVLSVKGRIVLADFNVKGMEIVEQCHVAEGGTHECFSQNLDSARKFFSDKGLPMQQTSSFTQDLIIVSRSK
ncbi:MAG: class I SAM-dependent methyltransferase [Candidatus Omnitrophota bacterium]